VKCHLWCNFTVSPKTRIRINPILIIWYPKDFGGIWTHKKMKKKKELKMYVHLLPDMHTYMHTWFFFQFLFACFRVLVLVLVLVWFSLVWFALVWFWDRVLLCSPGWPWTCNVAQAASASPVLELQAWVTIPSFPHDFGMLYYSSDFLVKSWSDSAYNFQCVVEETWLWLNQTWVQIPVCHLLIT
jgi:hypothetical protein